VRAVTATSIVTAASAGAGSVAHMSTYRTTTRCMEDTSE
jgi:hypothetical protein